MKAKNTLNKNPCFFHVSGKLPIYPSPKPTFTLSSYLWQNVGLGEGWVNRAAKNKLLLTKI